MSTALDNVEEKNTWIPIPSDYPPNRLFCLDLLRGLDMFYLAVVSAILGPLFQALKLDPSWKMFFCSHPWEGFTLYDLIMPLFIFMCGAAVPFALGRRMIDGRPAPGYWKHVWSRFALLWVLGMLAQGQLATLDVHQISPYNNTLQTIAVGYLAAAYVMTIRSWKIRVAIPLLLTVAYGLIVHFGGDYTKDGNITQAVELKILNAVLPSDNSSIKGIVTHGYTWFLPSLMFPVITLAGSFSTELLIRKDFGVWKRAGGLALLGLSSLAVGWVLALAGVKMVKHIFTVSFTLQAIGWSELSLAALFVLTDIWKIRKGTGLLLLFGQFALTAYLAEAVFRKACYAVSDRVFIGLQNLVPTLYAPVVAAVGYGIVVVAVVMIRRQLALQAAGGRGSQLESP